MFVRSNFFAKDAQVFAAATDLEVSEDLIVSSIFLYDIDDMLNGTSFANSLGDRLRCLAWSRWQSSLQNVRSANALLNY